MSPPMSKVPLLLGVLLLLLSRISAATVETTTDAAYTTEYEFDDTSTTPSSEDDDEVETDRNDGDWRNNTLIYYIWVRAFRDSDGDGNGDLQGIINRLDHLDDIGADTIRLSPIYASPMVDSGYDIQNYTEVNPMYGSLIDFDDLIRNVHKRGMRIILDIVPNHSSNQHEWFTSSAVTCNQEPYDDYYIWADGIVEDNKVLPPNDWKNVHSDVDGSAWTWHSKRRQWYYHRFHYTEPDLNLRNEDVIQEFLDIFDFWLEKGVDGFCISGISYFLEDENLHDALGDDDSNDNDEDDNSCCMGLSENADILYKFREHIDQWVQDNNAEPKMLLGEVDELDNNTISYYGNETHSGVTPLNTVLITKLNDTSDAADIKEVIDNWMECVPDDAKTNWILSDQDHSRASSRLNLELIDGLYMLTLLLPGQAMTYYGEEIGMLNGNLSREDTIDLRALERPEENYEDLSRDPYRTPMQWDATTSAGFSHNETTFLPVNPDYIEINVDRQLNDVDSNLEAYKKLSILREGEIFTQGDYKLDVVNDNNVLLLKRSLGNDSCIAIINFGSLTETVNLTAMYPDLEKDLQVMIDSSNADVEKVNDEDDDDDIENDAFVLSANAAAVLCDKEDFEEFTLKTSDSSEIDSANTTTTEEPSQVIPVTTTEAIAPSSAYAKEAFQFVIIIHVLLLSVLRIL